MGKTDIYEGVKTQKKQLQRIARGFTISSGLQDACGISSASPQSGHKTDDKSDGQSDDEDKENEAEDEEEGGGGWITPSNIGQVKMDCADWTAPTDVTVGCLTTDFAMQVNGCHCPPTASPRATAASSSCLSFQNVLIQIGLHVLSVNGMVIKQARSYILRCHACFRWGAGALCCIYNTAIQYLQR